MVTAEEINRKSATGMESEGSMRIRIDADASQKFLAGSGMSAADFQDGRPSRRPFRFEQRPRRICCRRSYIKTTRPRRPIFIRFSGPSSTRLRPATIATAEQSKGGKFLIFTTPIPPRHLHRIPDDCRSFTKKIKRTRSDSWLTGKTSDASL